MSSPVFYVCMSEKARRRWTDSTYKSVQSLSFKHSIFIGTYRSWSRLKCGLKKNQSGSFQQQFIVFARIYISFFFLFFFYCTEYVSTTQRDTVRLHPSISFLFPLCPTDGKREHLKHHDYFDYEQRKKNDLFVCLFWLFLKCLCVSLRLV